MSGPSDLSLPAPGSSGLGFALTVLDGRAALTLAPRPIPGGRIEALTLEIPGLRFPFDFSGGSRRFQHRRCLLGQLTLALGAPELSALLARAPLAGYGLHEPAVELTADGLWLAVRAAVGGAEAPLVAYARLEPIEGARVRLVFDDVRVYGLLPLPGPLLLAGLFEALSAGGAGGRVRVQGVGEVDLAIAELALDELLVGQGWRLPDREGIALGAPELSGGRLVLRFTRPTGDRAGPSVAAVVTEEGRARAPLDLLAEAESALAEGELRAALEGYRRAAALEARPGKAGLRRLQLLGAMPEAWEELIDTARTLDSADPGSAAALVALAQGAARAGRHAEAAVLYARLAEQAGRRGIAIDEAAARMAEGDAHRRAGQDAEAQMALEQALARRPGLRSAWGRLATTLGSAAQWSDLVSRFELAAGAATEASVRAELLARAGLARLEGLRDRDGAAARVAEAMALDPESPAAWEGRGRLAAAADRSAQQRAFERASALYAQAGLARDEAAMEVALVELELAGDGDLAGAGGAPAAERALDRLRRATDLDPEETEALGELAALCLRLGRPSEAYHALERALERARTPVQRTRLLRRLASAEYQHRRDPLAAGRLLARALGERPSDSGVLDDIFALRSEQGSLAGMRDLLARALAVVANDEERREVDRLLSAIAVTLGPSVGSLVRGRAAWTSGELAISARHFDEVLSAEGDSAETAAAAEANLRLAQWARVAGQMSNANRHLGRALEIEATARAPVEVLVEVLEAFGRTDDLLALLERRRADPRDPDERQQAARAAARLLERRGRAEEAEALYRQVLGESSDDLEALGGLAELYRREGRPRELAPTLERLLARALMAEQQGESTPIDVVDPEALAIELGVLLAETLEQPEGAERILRQVLAARPDSHEVRLSLLALLARDPAAAPVPADH